MKKSKAKPNTRIDDYPLPSGPLGKCASNAHWLGDDGGKSVFLGGCCLDKSLEQYSDAEFKQKLQILASAGLNLVITDAETGCNEQKLPALLKHIALFARRGFYVLLKLSKKFELSALRPLSAKQNVLLCASSSPQLREIDLILQDEKLPRLPIGLFDRDEAQSNVLAADFILCESTSAAVSANKSNLPTIICLDGCAGEETLLKTFCSGHNIALTSEEAPLKCHLATCCALADRMPLTHMIPCSQIVNSPAKALADLKNGHIIAYSPNTDTKLSFETPLAAVNYRFEHISSETGYSQRLCPASIDDSSGKITISFSGLLCISQIAQ